MVALIGDPNELDTVGAHYERAGLLTPKARLASAAVRGAEACAIALHPSGTALRFTLKEIRDLLILSNRRDVARVMRAAQAPRFVRLQPPPGGETVR